MAASLGTARSQSWPRIPWLAKASFVNPTLLVAKACLAIGAIGDVGRKQTEQLDCMQWALSKNAAHWGGACVMHGWSHRQCSYDAHDGDEDEDDGGDPHGSDRGVRG